MEVFIINIIITCVEPWHCALFQSVIEQVCRLTRVISSPHKVAHCVLIADGCPGRCRIIASLAAHLAGFSIFQINPSPISNNTAYDIAHYKADIVTAYSRAGVKVGMGFVAVVMAGGRFRGYFSENFTGIFTVKM